MSEPVSESQKNQSWALIGWCGLKSLFAKEISSEERSAKLGFGVLFNAIGFKNAPSSLAQSHKADNQSSLPPLMRGNIWMTRETIATVFAEYVSLLQGDRV